jgi:hypothetical protein
MGKQLPILVLCTALAAASGCGSQSASQTTTVATLPSTSTTRPPVSPPPTALTVFRVDAGVFQPEVVRVPHTTPVTISGGTARVQLNDATTDEVAEIVYTLTQFPSVTQVDVAGRAGLTRDDFAAYLPIIFVESPASGSDVPATITVSGTATVFEATLVVELVRDGKVLDKQTVTASEGAPARGTFSTTLHAPAAGPAIVTAFAPSAENGTPQHQVDVPVTVKP